MPIGFQNMPDFRFVSRQHDKVNLPRARGLAIFPSNITRSTTLDLQQRPDKPLPSPTLAFSCIIAADPRMKIAAAADAHLTDIIDDLGNVLLARPADDPHQHVW